MLWEFCHSCLSHLPIPIPFYSHVTIPLSVTIPKNTPHLFPFPQNSHGKNGNAKFRPDADL